MQIRCNLFRRTFGNNMSAAFAALGPHVDDPVGALDHVQVMLDYDQRAASSDQLAKGCQQLRYIVEVQTCGRLVQNVQHAAGLRRLGIGVGGAHALDATPVSPLRLAARERRSRLAQPQIAKPDLVENCKFFE